MRQQETVSLEKDIELLSDLIAVGTLPQTLDAMKEMVCLPTFVLQDGYVGFVKKSICPAVGCCSYSIH